MRKVVSRYFLALLTAVTELKKEIESEPTVPDPRRRAKKWSRKEDNILFTYYMSMGDYVVSMLKGRTRAECRERAKALGLASSGRSRPWSDEEKYLLRAYYKKKGPYIPELMRTRSPSAIKAQARKMGL